MKPKAKNYAFIDSQNLNLGVLSQNWKLDFAKFRKLGDLHCLIDYLQSGDKLLKKITPSRKYSSLLRKF